MAAQWIDRLVSCFLISALAGTGTTWSAAALPAAATVPAGEVWAVHGQFTYVEQEADAFNAPYAGPNSLTPDQGRETVDATLYLGARLGSSAEVWLNPEIDQGFGLDDTLGVAGFPSAEAYKVGRNQPYLRLPRLFVRSAVDLAGERETLEPGANQLGGVRSVNRWVFTVGKFSVVDIFDVNQYAHDPRGDCLNWSAVDAGSFDYAADAWGYTVGAAAEWYQGAWTTRFGVFDLSNVPNSEHLDRTTVSNRRPSRQADGDRIRQPRAHGAAQLCGGSGHPERAARRYYRRAPIPQPGGREPQSRATTAG